MVVKSELGVDKYSQVFNGIGTCYGGLKKFVIKDQSSGFPGEGNYCSFTNIEFHEVSSAPTLYRVNVSLKLIAVVGRFNGTKNFDIISEKKAFRMINYLAYVINKQVEK